MQRGRERGEERREKGEKRREEREIETKRDRKRETERGEREERDNKILKEKQSQKISCFQERLFLAKISLENPIKSIKIQFIKQSFKI